MKVIIITGVAGTTGSTILDMLSMTEEVQSGECKILGYDNLFKGVISNIEHHLNKNYFMFIEDDYKHILTDSYLNTVDLDIDTIYHMAAVVPTKYFYERPDLTFEVNCSNTIKLFYWAIGKKVKNFTVGSTSEVYGHINPNNLPISEHEMSHFDSVETTTRWSYAEGKLLTEHVLNQYKDRIKVCHLRFANTYGTRDMENDHLIPYLINSIMKNEDIRINKNPDDYFRTFLNNKDAAVAAIAVNSKGVSGAAYNVGTLEEFSISEVVDLVKKVVKEERGLDYTGSVYKDIERSGDPHRRVLSTERLYNDTGVVPSISLEEGLREMIEFCKYKIRKEY